MSDHCTTTSMNESNSLLDSTTFSTVVLSSLASMPSVENTVKPAKMLNKVSTKHITTASLKYRYHFTFLDYFSPQTDICFIFHMQIYGHCPKILYTIFFDKISHANSADPNQTAPMRIYNVCYSTKYFVKQMHEKQSLVMKSQE